MNSTTDQTHYSALTLANVSAVATAIIRRISGNDISTAINNSPVTGELISNLVQRRIAAAATEVKA